LISATAATPQFAAGLLLQKIADAFGRLEELTPMAVMMRKSVSDQVYVTPLALYKLAGER